MNKYQKALEEIKNLRTGGSSVGLIKGASVATLKELVERATPKNAYDSWRSTYTCPCCKEEVDYSRGFDPIVNYADKHYTLMWTKK